MKISASLLILSGFSAIGLSIALPLSAARTQGLCEEIALRQATKITNVQREDTVTKLLNSKLVDSSTHMEKYLVKAGSKDRQGSVVSVTAAESGTTESGMLKFHCKVVGYEPSVQSPEKLKF